MKIGIGTVIRFKRSGEHFYSFGVICYDHSSKFGRRKILIYDPKTKTADCMGWSIDYLLNCELVGKEKINNLNFYNGFTKKTMTYREYVNSFK